MSAGMLTTIRFAAAVAALLTALVGAQLFELAAPAVEREAPRVAFG